MVCSIPAKSNVSSRAVAGAGALPLGHAGLRVVKYRQSAGQRGRNDIMTWTSDGVWVLIYLALLIFMMVSWAYVPA